MLLVIVVLLEGSRQMLVELFSLLSENLKITIVHNDRLAHNAVRDRNCKELYFSRYTTKPSDEKT